MLIAGVLALFVAFGTMATACEKSNDVVARQQAQEAQDPCPKGCEEPPPGCRIKGNISLAGNKFYHLPSEKNYKQIIIQPEKGERWFCTEAEAQANGWRAIPNPSN